MRSSRFDTEREPSMSVITAWMSGSRSPSGSEDVPHDMQSGYPDIWDSTRIPGI
jgi:hypothetical protein